MITEILQLCNFLESGIEPSDKIMSVAQHPALDQLKQSQSAETIIAYLFIKTNLNDGFQIMTYLESSEFSNLSIPQKSKVLKFLYNERSNLSRSQQLQFIEDAFTHLNGFSDLTADFTKHLFTLKESYSNELINKTCSLNLSPKQKDVIRYVLTEKLEELSQYDWTNPDLNNAFNRQRLEMLKQALSTNKE